MHIHIVGGFLGSGKTTAIAAASKLIQEHGMKVGVVTNDQGKYLVDSRFLSAKHIPFGQVTNGCFCCNYNKLDEQINQLRDKQGVQVIFAESVGSCTDLIATVIKPLSVYKKGKTERLSLSIFAEAALLSDFLQNNHLPFSANINYIYSKQIEEAEFLIVNKTDLISPELLEELKKLVAGKFPEKTVLYQNSLDRESVVRWIDTLNQSSVETVPLRKSLDIDYQRYGSGEADLAWFDQEIKISSKAGNAVELGKQIVAQILAETENRQWSIGHLKFIIEANGQTEKISFTTNINRHDLEELSLSEASEAKMIINARIETDPDILKQTIAEIVQTIRTKSKATILELNTSAFKPGFPNPTHRMSNAE
ncbi:MAG TPA: GTP-binding protein [Prolixibacteraceae bacterium]|nr:GTP-binding protein [Prolixibacteraceae bacterium]